ncbi:hypothetical protein, partial [Streptomyces sp. 13-12-16]|uniref:hypothetical protein n=1 Tax=Streptomyces sp. 13-12-16 TaxID=1570823 RepID=UPI001C4FF548
RPRRRTPARLGGFLVSVRGARRPGLVRPRTGVRPGRRTPARPGRFPVSGPGSACPTLSWRLP